jgi:hypothetical protein
LCKFIKIEMLGIRLTVRIKAKAGSYTMFSSIYQELYNAYMFDTVELVKFAE